jgi:hypothetical protein
MVNQISQTQGGGAGEGAAVAVSAEIIDQVAAAVLLSGQQRSREHASREREEGGEFSPLLYTFHGDEYLGAGE